MEFESLIAAFNGSKRNKKLFGLVVYEIAGNGCLNGMWTNNFNSTTFMQEIARKTELTTGDNLIGEYSVTYIESNGECCNGILNITIPNSGRIYNLTWNIDGNIIFEGIGMNTGERQLTVFYWGIENE